MQAGEVSADFSENYSFILQDAAQGFHCQATIHPFVAYCREAPLNRIAHFSFVVISDCLQHDTIAGQLTKKFITVLMAQHHNTRIGKTSLICVFMNQILEYQLNGIFQLPHMAKVSVMALAVVSNVLPQELTYNDLQIMTPHQLYEWALENVPSITFAYCNEYEREKTYLEARF